MQQQTYLSTEITAAWPHEASADIAVWIRDRRQSPALQGRAVLAVIAGPAQVSLNPTTDELRRLAAALLAVADAQDRLDGADAPASLAGLTVTELPAVPQ